MAKASELSIVTSATALDMAQAMFGAGVSVVSATYTGDNQSSGVFSGGDTTAPGAVPADTGVILSTGKVVDFTNSSGDANQAANTSTNTSGVDNLSDLNSIAGVRTYDAAILEAEFIPVGDTLTMQLVFSSEEYLEWVDSGYNDAVGIWVNGEKMELAIGDGDISIDNINPNSNPNLFIDNAGSLVNSEMDGVTVVLTVKAPVEPGVTNTIRFGIADAGDAVYDSNLLIVGESVQTQLIAGDDFIAVTARGETVVDLMDNDSIPEGATVSITHINGHAISEGESITLPTGEVLTLNADGTLHVQGGNSAGQSVITYEITDVTGVSDTAYATIATDPVDGTAGNDKMTAGYVDADGNMIDGADGAAEVIMGYGGNDKIFAGAGDDAVYGGEGNDFMRGYAGDDLIDGGEGRDVLDGGKGADTMMGGTGNDVYFVDDVNDVVSEAGGDGVDTVKTTVNFTLDADLENVWLKGSTATTAIGNNSKNMIVGNKIDNTLSGLGGDDRLLGYDGDDTIDGGTGNDIMNGGNGQDVLTGGTGNDKLFSESGADVLDGGGGNDHLRAGSGDDQLTGGADNDVLDGGSGDDVMVGGTGNDVYYVDTAADVVTELSGEGRDKVVASMSYTLEQNVEDLKLVGEAVAGTGNDGANLMFGSNNANILSGEGGNDAIAGSGGDDLLLGGAGNDRLYGGKDNDTMEGGEGRDKLYGGAGDDVVDGGTDNDVLYGGAGHDAFVFHAGDGADAVGDFDPTADTLIFEGVSADELSVHARGSGIEISYGSGDCVYLASVGKLSLSDLDIVFG